MSRRLPSLILLAALMMPACDGVAILHDGGPGPAVGLLAHLPLDDGKGDLARDVTNSGYNGSIFGQPLWVAGVSGYALRLDGTDDQVTITGWPVVDGPFSVAIWVRRTGPGDKEKQDIIRYNAPSKDDGFLLRWWPDGQLHFMLCTTELKYRCYRQLPDPSRKSWIHLAATWDGALVRLYTDGALAHELKTKGKLAYPKHPLTIGGKNSFFQGEVDDLRIYGRALSPGEVHSLATPASP